MTQRTFLDYNGLQRFLNNLKTIIPTKTSDITNDSGFLTQHNPVDSSLSDTSTNAVQNKVVKGALDGKSDTGHTHTASEVSGLSTVATSGSYNDLSNTPTIPTVNNATLTIQKNGSTVKTFTANASSNVTANITVPTAVSELTNDSGYLTSASSLDSSKLTGTIDIARLPKGALERLVTVANQTARFALTVNDVQLGDTVKQLDTGVMYIVTDETKLSSADGYTEYTAGSATSVPWSGVTGKPSSFTPSSHTHGNVTNDGKLPTASRALISDSSKNITVSSVSDTELGYLSGVTSAIQTQLNGKAASDHVHGSITNDGKLGTASRALVTDSSKNIAVSTVTATELGYVSGVTSAIQTQLNGKSASNHVHGNITNDGKVGTTANLPLITGTGGVVQAGSFGTAANTFCEGNDSRLSDARTPVAHTHLTSDVTDLLNTSHEWTKVQTYSDANAIIIKNNSIEIGNEPSAYNEQRFLFRDKNNQQIAAIKYQNQLSSANTFASGLEFSITDKFKNGVRDATGTATTAVLRIGLWNDGTKYIYNECRWRSNLLPFANNANDIGSSSYQWNNIYSKGYYYNGTPWGLDKANVWTNTNKFYGITITGHSGISWLRDGYTAGTLPETTFYYGFQNAYDSNGDVFERIRSRIETTGKNMREHYKYAWSDLSKYIHKGFWISNDGSDSEQSFLVNRVIPETDNATDLGTTTNRWKTLNGVNPGALSLPDYSRAMNIDTTNWSKDGSMIVYTPTFDGWLQITIPNDDDDQGNKSNMIAILDSGTSPLAGFSVSNVLGSRLYFLYPVRASRTYWLYVKSYSTTITTARLVKCLGNV